MYQPNNASGYAYGQAYTPSSNDPFWQYHGNNNSYLQRGYQNYVPMKNVSSNPSIYETHRNNYSYPEACDYPYTAYAPEQNYNDPYNIQHQYNEKDYYNEGNENNAYYDANTQQYYTYDPNTQLYYAYDADTQQYCVYDDSTQQYYGFDPETQQYYNIYQPNYDPNYAQQQQYDQQYYNYPQYYDPYGMPVQYDAVGNAYDYYSQPLQYDEFSQQYVYPQEINKFITTTNKGQQATTAPNDVTKMDAPNHYEITKKQEYAEQQPQPSRAEIEIEAIIPRKRKKTRKKTRHRSSKNKYDKTVHSHSSSSDGSSSSSVKEKYGKMNVNRNISTCRDLTPLTATTTTAETSITPKGHEIIVYPSLYPDFLASVVAASALDKNQTVRMPTIIAKMQNTKKARPIITTVYKLPESQSETCIVETQDPPRPLSVFQQPPATTAVVTAHKPPAQQQERFEVIPVVYAPPCSPEHYIVSGLQGKIENSVGNFQRKSSTVGHRPSTSSCLFPCMNKHKYRYQKDDLRRTVLVNPYVKSVPPGNVISIGEPRVVKVSNIPPQQLNRNDIPSTTVRFVNPYTGKKSSPIQVKGSCHPSFVESNASLVRRYQVTSVDGTPTAAFVEKQPSYPGFSFNVNQSQNRTNQLVHDVVHLSQPISTTPCCTSDTQLFKKNWPNNQKRFSEFCVNSTYPVQKIIQM